MTFFPLFFSLGADNDGAAAGTTPAPLSKKASAMMTIKKLVGVKSMLCLLFDCEIWSLSDRDWR
jgi:hypothetical protein